MGNYTMPKIQRPGKDEIIAYFRNAKIATLEDLKKILDTNGTMTVFRKMKELGYLSSYSHRGKYYTLFEIAQFNEEGLWSNQSVWFSKYGNLIETARELIENAETGFTSRELENIVNVEVRQSLLKLFKQKNITREKVFGKYVYFSADKIKRKRQLLLRQEKHDPFDIDVSTEVEVLSHELIAAIILFFSILDERQRRLYAGLESMKLGHGGDVKIAKILGLNVHTVAKGRKEIFSGELETEGIRIKGGGRKSLEKKHQK